jgi:DNA polymerase (family 10)
MHPISTMTTRRISNTEVANALREMALFLEMDDVPWRPQAYEKAAYAVTALDRPLAEIFARGGLAALEELPGIGKGIAGRIAAMLDSGVMADLEALREKTPIDLPGLTAIDGVGAKTARALWRALGVRSVADLKRAAEEGRIRGLPHFGQKSERNLLQAIAFLEEAAGRRPLGGVLELAIRLETALAQCPGVVAAAVAGSIRRRRDTVGDVDLLCASTAPARVGALFESLPEVRTVLAHGPTKTVVRLSNGLDADLRVLEPDAFGAALLYFTGSKAHNIALRKLALKQRLLLNEYGLFAGERRIAGRTEEEVYQALGLAWVPPELREDSGEVELARKHALPQLVDRADLRGDLQMHTSWTDGSASIEDMARAAKQLGREYIAITDHTRDLAMTGGLDEARLHEQLERIRAAEREVGGIHLLAGAEVNVRPDGSLDVDAAALAELDLVGAALHSHLDQPRAEMTERIVRAVENPQVDILFHPLARLIGRRRAVDVDLEQVIAACARTGTILELDAHPERLDLPDALVRRAIEAGVRIAVDSDAHTVDELRFVETFGLGAARRGWAGPGDVVNTLPYEQLRETLKRGRAQRASKGAPRTPASGEPVWSK